MPKPTLVLSAPVDTYSGYGARARDFAKALIALQTYDVKILSQRWGNTPFGFLNHHGEAGLMSRVITKLNGQPDVWIQLTVPNEFQPVGKFNIGVTAAMETTLCDPSWVQGVNRMNLTLVSSEHSKQSLLNSTFEQKDKNTGQIMGKIQVEKPIEVLFEGVNLMSYMPPKENKLDLSMINESFCFLTVGHWLPGALGEDRKNIGYTVKAFLESFKNKPTPPALILKTSASTASIMDREDILNRIDDIRKTVKGKLPNIYLFHGDIKDSLLNQLYHHPKVKAMVSLTKGEGFGRPLLEFSFAKKPIIASGWSGHVDFLDKDLCNLVGGELTQVHPSAVQKNVILAEASWFTPDAAKVHQAFKRVFKHYKDELVKAKKLGSRNIKEFELSKMAEKLDSYLTKYVPEFPKQINLDLPKLNLPKLKKAESKPEIKLPKLKKL